MHALHSPIARAGRRAARWAQFYAGLWLVAACLATPFLDSLTSVLLLLSTFLFTLVCCYSYRYLLGDPGQPRFMFWLCLTGTLVFGLVLSRHLLWFALAWCGLSLSLHQLLQFYRDRPAALAAARKKFLISRLGDLALLAALVLTHRQFGAFDFPSLFLAADRLRAAGPENLPPAVAWLCACLVLAALLKSAQFPFHTWLPDTMETPTPVSALMHAGIINAGGILILRLSPLISLSAQAMFTLCLVGAVTALVASLVMLTQASVKRCLAFSTVAQMGFMMLECGLGAFHLALLHLVGHSLYKAYAFLSTGSAVTAAQPRPTRPGLPTVLAGLAFGTLLSVAIALAIGVTPLDQVTLHGIFALALAQMWWSLWTQLPDPQRLFGTLAASALLSAVYFALHRLVEPIVKPLPPPNPWLSLMILALFLLLALGQSQLAAITRTAWGRRIYVHARNGFYLNTLANRLTHALWPARLSTEGI